MNSMLSPPPSSPATNTTAASPPTSQPMKAKGKPTVTPRSFRRFFTPRNVEVSSLTPIGAREPLGDVTTSAINRQSRVSKRRLPKSDSARLFDEDENPESGSNNLSNGRKRPLCSPESTPGSSTPSKKHKIEDPSTDKTESHAVDLGVTITENDDNPCPRVADRPVQVSRYRSRLGELSRREIDMPSRAAHRSIPYVTTDWRSHVANFNCDESGFHAMRNSLAPEGHETSLPFCTSACHTNPLVAVGDEDGVIRMLDTQDGSRSFRKAWVSFRPHANAIVDMEFSHNDAFLATVSGDQTGQIIDMPTQTTIYELKNLDASAKQIRYQPGSNGNVLATSTREGAIKIWDRRCKASSVPPDKGVKCDLGGPAASGLTTFSTSSKVIGAASVNTIWDAHVYSSRPGMAKKTNTDLRSASITAISFLTASTPHLLLSGSEANASIKLWDLRMKQASRARLPSPLGSTQQPSSHSGFRTYGLTSMVVNSNATRAYAVCKDNNVYAYSVPHLMLGSAPELAGSWKPRRNGGDKEGLGPIYSLRHESLKVSTFYVKSALRPARMDGSELLAVGSATGTPVVFSLDEKLLNKHQQPQMTREGTNGASRLSDSTTIRPTLSRTSSMINSQRPKNDLPLSTYGASLENGHTKEVTSMTWSSNGELVTVADDYRCRVWREDASRAANLRKSQGRSINRFDGWADLGSFTGDWDDED